MLTNFRKGIIFIKTFLKESFTNLNNYRANTTVIEKKGVFMKNTTKTFGIIVFAMVIAFAFFACEGPRGPMGPAGSDGIGIQGQPGEPGYNGPVIITFDSDNGDQVKIQQMLGGNWAHKPTKDPTKSLPGTHFDDIEDEGLYRSAYVFDGWYLEDELYDFDTPVNDNITLTAHWSNPPIDLFGYEDGDILIQSVSYINDNPGGYILLLDSGITLPSGTLSLTGVNAELTLMGIGTEEKIISYTPTNQYAFIFDYGARVTLGKNIVIDKSSGAYNTGGLLIRNGGLIMKTGSKIQGSSVQINMNGVTSFITVEGGTLSGSVYGNVGNGNFVMSGGTVNVVSNCNHEMSGGIITTAGGAGKKVIRGGTITTLTGAASTILEMNGGTITNLAGFFNRLEMSGGAITTMGGNSSGQLRTVSNFVMSGGTITTLNGNTDSVYPLSTSTVNNFEMSGGTIVGGTGVVAVNNFEISGGTISRMITFVDGTGVVSGGTIAATIRNTGNVTLSGNARISDLTLQAEVNYLDGTNNIPAAIPSAGVNIASQEVRINSLNFGAYRLGNVGVYPALLSNYWVGKAVIFPANDYILPSNLLGPSGLVTALGKFVVEYRDDTTNGQTPITINTTTHRLSLENNAGYLRTY